MKRNFGLDLIRAAAILFVLADHAWYFRLDSLKTPNLFSVFGFIGVELFFVLSGFLIGHILVKNFDQSLSLSTLQTFYKRRWLRTLPLYYLLLVVMIAGTAVLTRHLDLHLTHFIFIQNFFPHEIDFFGVAWSLSVEEWFYLLLPLFFTPIALNIRRNDLKITVVSLTILSLLLLRTLFVLDTNEAFEMIRRNIALRFDALLMGVLLTMIKNYYQRIYRFLQSFPIFLVSLFGIFLIGKTYTHFYLEDSIDQSLFLKTIGFTILSLCIAGIIPYIETNSSINIRFTRFRVLYSLVTAISTVSYSLYLIHSEIFIALSRLLSGRIAPILVLLLALSISFISASVTYLLVEKPMMALRDRRLSFSLENLLSSFSMIPRVRH
jgi:peptidoglycan/LPS O-acetylase OafA/YrhL